jgi:hypothetical protein
MTRAVAVAVTPSKRRLRRSADGGGLAEQQVKRCALAESAGVISKLVGYVASQTRDEIRHCVASVLQVISLHLNPMTVNRLLADLNLGKR